MNNSSVEIASLINEGNIVANFNGRMEFGERALGNRSILADPRKKEMKDKIKKIMELRDYDKQTFIDETMAKTILTQMKEINPIFMNSINEKANLTAS